MIHVVDQLYYPRVW